MNVRNERNDGPKLTSRWLCRPRLRLGSPRSSRSPRSPHLLVILALITGCHGSSEKKQEKLRQERASWEATARLTDELSQKGAVPEVYRRQVMEKSSKNLDKIRQQEQQLSQ
jgi:hypothetical protein